MKRNVLLFVFILIVSCKASYPWYDFMVFQNGNNSPAHRGIEHIILRSNSNYMYCTEHDGRGERYLNIGEWEQRMDTLFLYPGYGIDLLNPKYIKKIEVLQSGDTITDSTDFLGFANFTRIFLVRDSYILEITDSSVKMRVEDGKIIWLFKDFSRVEEREFDRIKLTSRKGKFNLLEYLNGYETTKK